MRTGLECVRVAVWAILRDFVPVTDTCSLLGHFWVILGKGWATLGHFGAILKVFEVFDEVSRRLAWFGMD